MTIHDEIQAGTWDAELGLLDTTVRARMAVRQNREPIEAMLRIMEEVESRSYQHIGLRASRGVELNAQVVHYAKHSSPVVRGFALGLQAHILKVLLDVKEECVISSCFKKAVKEETA